MGMKPCLVESTVAPAPPPSAGPPAPRTGYGQGAAGDRRDTKALGCLKLPVAFRGVGVCPEAAAGAAVRATPLDAHKVAQGPLPWHKYFSRQGVASAPPCAT